MTQVYVHGLGQTPASWGPVLSLLDASDEPVCPDLTQLVSAKEINYSHLYGAFAQFCDNLEAPLALCGLSLGGVLALHYAAEHPERVGSLVLIALQYRMPKRLLRMQNALFHVMPSSMFRGTGFSKAQMIQLCGSMLDLDLSGRLSDISCPTLILRGNRDRANKLACTELAQLLRRAELHIVEGAGHEVNREAPEQLAVLLRAFYAQTLD